MHNLRNLFLLTLFGVTGVGSSLLAQEVRVELQPQQDTVRQGAMLQLSYLFEDVDPGQFELPELVGLTLVGGPSTQSQTTFVNGQRNSSLRYTYRVVADQAGMAYVPPYEVVAASGDTLRSSEIRVHVEPDATYIPLSERKLRESRPDVPRRPRVRM